jgi:hypothetical protein
MENQSQKPMQRSQVPSAGNKISELRHHLIATQGYIPDQKHNFWHLWWGTRIRQTMSILCTENDD